MQEQPLQEQARSVFVSYRVLDDEPPPGEPEDSGFVRYLSRQLRWELDQLGVPDAVLWRDRVKIFPADDWSQVIFDELSKADLFLAVLSKNYVRSSWCTREISTMASRIENLAAEARPRRIFRVDKHSVPEEQIPSPLRGVQAVRFYAKDRETKRDVEYFWRGVVRRKQEYIDAIHELAVALYERLVQLGLPVQAEAPQQIETAALNKGPVIFVAKPGGDMVDEYQTLTRELSRKGYRVVPDPDKCLPSDGEAVRALIIDALATSTASVHILGERTGGRPDGLDIDLVPLQLASAAVEAKKMKTSFQRLIWAPKVLPRDAAISAPARLRDPLQVLERFDQRLPSDQIDGDTPTRFNEFVLQRLGGEIRVPAVEARAIYIYSSSSDRKFGLSIARELKRNGFAPLLKAPSSEGTAQQLAQAEQKVLSRVRCVIVCWDAQTRAQIMTDVMDPALQTWRGAGRKDNKLILVLGPPESEAKAEVAEFGFGPDVDCVVDTTRTENTMAAIDGHLVPALEQPS
jgi:hypothetical protein